MDAPLGQIRVAPEHAAGAVDRAANGVDSAGELDEHAVARGLDLAAAVFGDFRIDQLLPVSRETRKRLFRVDSHEPTVTDHVGR